MCNRQRVGWRVKCQTTFKTGVSFVRGDQPNFPLLTVYVANSAFSVIIWSNYFHAKAIQLLQDGSSVGLVSRRLGVSPRVISRAWRRFWETDQFSKRAVQGRRRATPHQQDRYLVLFAREFNRSTARSLQSDLERVTGLQISDQTVRNRLHGNGLWSWRPFVGLILTPRHYAARRAFAKEHHWQVHHWRHVLFTDESRFNLSGSDGRVKVWISTGECYQACSIIQHDIFDGGVLLRHLPRRT